MPLHCRSYCVPCNVQTLILLYFFVFSVSRRGTGLLLFILSFSCGALATRTTTAPTSSTKSNRKAAPKLSGPINGTLTRLAAPFLPRRTREELQVPLNRGCCSRRATRFPTTFVFFDPLGGKSSRLEVVTFKIESINPSSLRTMYSRSVFLFRRQFSFSFFHMGQCAPVTIHVVF